MNQHVARPGQGLNKYVDPDAKLKRTPADPKSKARCHCGYKNRAGSDPAHMQGPHHLAAQPRLKCTGCSRTAPVKEIKGKNLCAKCQ
jgi:hypothetical protein